MRHSTESAPTEMGQRQARSGGGRKRAWKVALFAGLGLLAGLVALFVVDPEATGETGSQAAGQGGNWVLFIDPEESSTVTRFVARTLAEDGGQLGMTQSEYWTIPSSPWRRAATNLRLLSSKITRLPDDWNHLLKPQKDPAELTDAHAEALQKVRTSPEFVSLGLMKAQHAAVAEYALTVGADAPAPIGNKPPKSASRVVIPLNDALQVTIQRAEIVKTARGTSWRGTIEETGESALLMWWKGGRISGVFAYKGRIYTIVNVSGDVHAVVESNPTKLPPDHAPATSDKVREHDERSTRRSSADSEEASPSAKEFKPLTDAERKALEAKKVTIDLMILYTKKAASHHIRDPQDVIELAIAQANETFRNSGIGNVQLRLVHSQRVDYQEAGSQHFEHLYAMVDGLDAFKHVRRLRNEKRADIVGLIVDDPSGCGLSTRVGADAEEAFFVVHNACATLTVSIAHEVGHILGARHNRSTDKISGPFPYGHGYVNGTKWRDVMSYHQACNGCPRIPFWSNPRVSYQGEPTGTDMEDSARVVLEQAERVAGFR
jgi:hypothetical protein